MAATSAVSIASRLEDVQARIQAALRRAGRNDDVTLVAVTKVVTVDRIAEAYRVGVRHFGENRVQEFEGKQPLLTLPDAVWHLVGHLQTNKARRALDLFSRIDSLDSVRLAEKLASAAREAGKTVPVLVQVHLGEESSKFGVDPGQLAEMVEQMAALSGLRVEGLMAVPPLLAPVERVRPFFQQLRRLAEDVERRRIPGVTMRELSMGMSHDFEIAIEEGATQVRLGTAVFGARPKP